MNTTGEIASLREAAVLHRGLEERLAAAQTHGVNASVHSVSSGKAKTELLYKGVSTMEMQAQAQH